MSSAAKESFKQDLVVSIRYRNELPPPPMPPKFLDIDTGGISQYLTTSYASSLARREEPNIDADAEGGMPIDMIGIPGYFLGDESAIMAPDTAPVLDPADQALMLTAEQLKTQGSRNNVSFLRKNQYLSSQNARTGDRLNAGTPRPQKSINKNASSLLGRNDKENIKRYIQKGFDTAYPDSIPYNPPQPANTQKPTDPERLAWKQPRHPGNPRAKPVAFYPILPDLETGTDSVSWGRVKFDKPPLPANHGKRDDRIDSALFLSVPNEKAEAQWQAAKEAFERDPKSYEDPGPTPPYTWVMTLPQNPEHTSRIRKVVYDGHPDRNDPALRDEISLETDDGTPRIPFTRSRVYNTVQQTSVLPNRFMALGLYNPDSPSNSVPPSTMKRNQGPAAYFYPISENARFKADRSKLAKHQRYEEDEAHIDRMMVATTEPNPSQKSIRAAFRGRFDDKFKTEWEVLQQEAEKWAEEQEQAQQDVEMDGGGEVDGKVNGSAREGGDGTPRRSAEGDADAMDND